MNSDRDKYRKLIGIGIIFILFFFFIIILVYTIKPFSTNVKPFDESPIIKQRIINLEKSNK